MKTPMGSRLSLFASLIALLMAVTALPALAGGDIVVANRGSGTISVIDVASNTATTVAMPAGSNPAEPMYVGYSATYRRVFVGDRGNNRVVVFRADDYSVEDTIPAGAGIFHMWPEDARDQMWVNNDIDNTITVIDTVSLAVLATPAAPADLVALGGKVHDVIVDPRKPFAFVSMIGVGGPDDYVVKYSTETFLEVGRVAVGKDPHLSLVRQKKLLYVPCQNSNAVFVFDRQSLAKIDEIPVPAAHGAGMSRNGSLFFTTNIAGGGTDGLVGLDTGTNTVVDTWDTPFPVPHNIALTPNSKNVYVTHSGATANQVSIFARKDMSQPLELVKTVTTGLNPFGLAYVP